MIKNLVLKTRVYTVQCNLGKLTHFHENFDESAIYYCRNACENLSNYDDCDYYFKRLVFEEKKYHRTLYKQIYTIA